MHNFITVISILESLKFPKELCSIIKVSDLKHKALRGNDRHAAKNEDKTGNRSDRNASKKNRGANKSFLHFYCSNAPASGH